MVSEYDWSGDVFAAMQARQISTVATVPDGGLTRFLLRCRGDADMHVVTLTTEEEGIGLTTGLWLGGSRGMIALQSSGIGNCINALTLPAAMRAPVLMLVTMRGHWGEFNPWQVPMSRAARPALEAVGVTCMPVDRAEEVGETFAAAADMAFNTGTACAVMISQRIIGAKSFGQGGK